MPIRQQSRYDAVIVGARAAGASTALLLAQAGLRVLAIDKSAYGSDTTSTHALMRPAVLQLHRWGVLDRIVEAGTPAIRKTTFHYGLDREGDRIEVDIRPKDGVDALYAPRRTVLDTVLVDAAVEAGAEVIHDATVQEVLRDSDGRVTGVRFRDALGFGYRVDADLVIGADGVRSLVARSVGAEVTRTTNRPAACIYGYWRGLELDGTHWYYAPDAAAGVIPTNDGHACVFVAMRPERFLRHRSIGLDALYHEVLRDSGVDLARDANAGWVSNVDADLAGGANAGWVSNVDADLSGGAGAGWVSNVDADLSRDANAGWVRNVDADLSGGAGAGWIRNVDADLAGGAGGGSVRRVDADARVPSGRSLSPVAATLVGKLHPFAGAPGFLRRSWGEGWALVGDAGFFRDPLTAHGLTDALRHAELLARAILTGGDAAMATYQTSRDAEAIELMDLSDEIASFDWDLEHVKAMHHQLSKLMGREYGATRELDSVASPAALQAVI
ncbi:MAG: FAD-dependent monooxygenase [Candidatus Eisenbacteria bacterium]|uniref:FAD-dependent monooxygenase n=1 Tax=Eiseniibacteriota bacterium TaxID=2212470 RepID=A0A956M019_UNCEI|nr:FAD-dependent monooxygenase [Candidatus Eisenbacteria bacterium]